MFEQLFKKTSFYHEGHEEHEEEHEENKGWGSLYLLSMVYALTIVYMRQFF